MTSLARFANTIGASRARGRDLRELRPCGDTVGKAANPFIIQ